MENSNSMAVCFYLMSNQDYFLHILSLPKECKEEFLSSFIQNGNSGDNVLQVSLNVSFKLQVSLKLKCEFLVLQCRQF